MARQAAFAPDAAEAAPGAAIGARQDQYGQPDPDQTAPVETDQSQFGDIIVTARRREESSQSVPIVVTSVSSEQLEAATVTTGTDLQKLVPSLNVGVTIFGAGQQYSLRGVRTGVVTYFNEVPVGSSTVDLQLWDLQSVQALSGPQGTLFGTNSTGGAVLFAPTRPTDGLEGHIDFRVGSYGLREITGVLNLPLAETLKVRLGAQRTVRDEIVKNLTGRDLGTQDRLSLRGSIFFEPTDWLSNYTTFVYSHRDEQPNAQISGSDGAIGACPVNTISCVYGPAYAAELEAQRLRGIRTVSIPVDSVLYEEPWQVTNVLAAEFGAFTVKYLFGYAENEAFQRASQLSISLPVIIGENGSTSSLMSHELELLGSAFDGRLDFVTGLFYSHSKSDGLNSFLLFAQPGTPLNDLTTQQSGGLDEKRSKAVYAQGTFAITDRFNLTAGVRYTEDEASTSQLSFTVGRVCALPDFPNVDRTTCRQAIDLTSDAVTYNFAADYKITDDILIYATTRRGYNGGGFNAAINDPDLQIVRPEFITDYEGGIKSDFDIGSVPVRFNVSGFYAKYTDIQRTTSLINDGVIVTGFFNAANAELFGAQLELLMRPFPELDIQGSYGYLQTRYINFDNPLLGDLSGNKFAQAPAHTGRVSATYRHQLPVGELVGNASYAYISEVTFADNNLGTPGNTADGYGLIDLRLDWKNINDQGVDLGLYVKNLTNEVYVLNATDRTTPFGFVSRLYGDPRTFGVQLRYSFDR